MRLNKDEKNVIKTAIKFIDEKRTKTCCVAIFLAQNDLRVQYKTRRLKAKFCDFYGMTSGEFWFPGNFFCQTYDFKKERALLLLLFLEANK